MSYFRTATVIFSFILFATSVSFADDVTDQIDEALKAYNKRDYSTAATALDAAATLIRQARADSLSQLLPKPLPGWKMKKQTNTAAALFGGGINAQKTYINGKQKIKIALTSDSPMLQAMAIMFANPQMAGADAKLVVVDGRKIIHNRKKNSFQAMVANRVLVSVEGGRNTDESAVKKYLKSIDFNGVEKFAR